MSASAAVDALRDLPPNARITVTQGSRRFGVEVNAATIVRDYDAAVADADYWRSRAMEWERLAIAAVG